MNSTDYVKHENYGFDSRKYLDLQTLAIKKRIEKFNDGRLYLEIGGKLLSDPHAQRVLPGFNPESKIKILKSFYQQSEILFCLDYEAILTDRQLKNTAESYRDISEATLKEIEKVLNIRPIVVVNRVKDSDCKEVKDFIKRLESQNYKVYKRYFIPGYPKDLKNILSPNGFEKDDYIELSQDLIIVTGPASNSGKLSTCLGQIYLDKKHGIESGYAKFELFPIWNLPLEHPVNLAYEAATVDIGDYNVNDKKHFREYGELAVNYNRDEEAFEILKTLADNFISPKNYLKQYKSPTDMGINMAGMAITDDKIVTQAAIEEIRRRKVWYQEIVNRGDGKLNWVVKCRTLELEAERFFNNPK